MTQHATGHASGDASSLNATELSRRRLLGALGATVVTHAVVRVVRLTATVLLGAVMWAPQASAEPNGTPKLSDIRTFGNLANQSALADLGRHLFFDPRLVLNEQQSCASCHSPHMGFADGVAIDLVAHKDWKRAKRNSPSLVNLAWAPVLHWDGRTPDGQCFVPEDTKVEVCLPPLESQAFKSTRSRKVYDGFLPKVKLIPAYQELFAKAFPPNGEITHVNMALAIAAFERTIISINSPYDQFLQGRESALSEPAQRGLALFQGKARCTACHSGPNFTDWRFHNIGVDSEDAGRGKRVKSDADKLKFHRAFKTPGLRNVALTAPYMHNGSVKSLEDVVEFYDRGGDNETNRSALVQPLNLTGREKWELIEFLHALTESLAVDVPTIPAAP